MSIYPGDPGGMFESDYHRRVTGHLPKPDEDLTTLGELWGRMFIYDVSTNIEEQDELSELLEELVNSGLVAKEGYGYKMTNAGLEALCAEHPDPKVNEPMEGQRLKRAQEADEEMLAVDTQNMKDAAVAAAKVAQEVADNKVKEAEAL